MNNPWSRFKLVTALITKSMHNNFVHVAYVINILLFHRNHSVLRIIIYLGGKV